MKKLGREREPDASRGSYGTMQSDSFRGRAQGATREDALAADPLVYKVDQANLRRIRELLPQEVERNLPPEAGRKLE